jgi:dTDP-4-dehydrorhamnose reductase
MKILILGAKGMLGRDLVTTFKNHLVIAWDKEELDITKENEVIKKITDLKPDLVINAAAYTQVDLCEEEKNYQIAHKVNALAVKYLAKITKTLQIPLVYYSTDYVFDGNNPQGYPENYSQIAPLNKYGETKALGEKYLKDNPQHYLIRTQWLFGKNGPNFIEKRLENFDRLSKLKIVNDQFGSPTFTKDLAEKTREIIETKKPFGTYHVTNSGITDWHSYALEIFKLARHWTPENPKGKKVLAVKSHEFPAPAKRPHHSALLNTKLKPLRSWQKALQDYLEN